MDKEHTCDRCYKSVSGLPEFPSGRKLEKTFRTMYEGPAIDEYEQILDEYHHEEGKDNMNELEAKYGHEKVDKALIYDQLSSTVGSSWECINCINK